MIGFKNILLLIVFFIGSSSFVLANDLKGIALAQKILDDLYDVSGQYVYKKPKLKLSDTNERVAAYSPSKNLITIDEKALAICESMGSEAANALAFLIGHELAHAFQKEVRHQGKTTHFLAYDHYFDSMIRTEKVADIQGVFAGYLSGYGMKAAIPAVLEKIYKAYNLMGVDLPNYPTFEERQKSANEVISRIDELIDLFEVNAYMLALGEYEESIFVMEHMLEYYQGYEIQNNLGAAYLYIGLEFIDPHIDNFSYPVRLYGNSSLQRIDTTRGELPYHLRMTRNFYLENALDYFNTSINLNRHHTIAKINKACVLNLLQKEKEALIFLNGSDFSNKEKRDANYKLIYAITSALTNDKITAKTILNSLATNQNAVIAMQAEHNLNTLKGSEFTDHKQKADALPNDLIIEIKNAKLGSSRNWNAVIFKDGKEFKIEKSNRLKKYRLSDDLNNGLFSLIIQNSNSLKINLLNQKAYNFNTALNQRFVYSDKYFFLKSDSDKVIIKCDLEGNILEIAKFNTYPQ